MCVTEEDAHVEEKKKEDQGNAEREDGKERCAQEASRVCQNREESCRQAHSDLLEAHPRLAHRSPYRAGKKSSLHRLMQVTSEDIRCWVPRV